MTAKRLVFAFCFTKGKLLHHSVNTFLKQQQHTKAYFWDKYLT